MERRIAGAVVFNGVAAMGAALLSLVALFGRDAAFFARTPSVPLFVVLLTGAIAVPTSFLLIAGLHTAGAAQWGMRRAAPAYGALWTLTTFVALALAWLVFRAEARTWGAGVLAEIVGRTVALTWGLPLALSAAMGGWTAYLLHRAPGEAS